MNHLAEIVPERPRALAVRGEFGGSLTAADIRHRVNVIQEVMQAVMKKDVHYGVIPGCDKPTLFKPGSEVLLATFQIAPSIHVTDLSTSDCIRYQVRVLGTHAPTGTVVGEGIGECSSNEEKYKWRKASDDEWEATPENRRRIKHGKYKTKQVRTEPADVANTILKMAKKRAQIDMTLTATGASDCFEQDIEDLPEELQPENRGSGGNGNQQGAAEQKKPETKPAAPDEWFQRNLKNATPLLRSGTRTADEVIATLKTKASLSAEQEQAIRAIKPEETKS